MNYDVDTGKKTSREKKGMIMKREWKVGEIPNFIEYAVYRVKIARK